MYDKVIIFSDYGLDDAVAAAYLLKTCKCKSIDIVAIAGNTTAENSLNNAVKLLHNSSKCEAKITLVDTTDEPQNYAHLPSIHGNDGMGDLFSDVEYPKDTIKFDKWLASIDPDSKPTIVSLGPATLVVPLIKKLNLFKDKNSNNSLENNIDTNIDNNINIKSKSNILMMGHNIDHEPNYMGEEFNFALDIENFEWCLKNTDCVVATLDTCRASTFNLAGKHALSDDLFAKLLNKSIHLATLRHSDNAYIYDYIAVRYLTTDEFEIVDKLDKRGNNVRMLNVKQEVDLLI